jgi:hypothetical protein
MNCLGSGVGFMFETSPAGTSGFEGSGAASVRRLKLYGIATDRILGLPDGSTVVLNRKQVEAMVALL